MPITEKQAKKWEMLFGEKPPGYQTPRQKLFEHDAKVQLNLAQGQEVSPSDSSYAKRRGWLPSATDAYRERKARVGMDAADKKELSPADSSFAKMEGIIPSIKPLKPKERYDNAFYHLKFKVMAGTATPGEIKAYERVSAGGKGKAISTSIDDLDKELKDTLTQITTLEGKVNSVKPSYKINKDGEAIPKIAPGTYDKQVHESKYSKHSNQQMQNRIGDLRKKTVFINAAKAAQANGMEWSTTDVENRYYAGQAIAAKHFEIARQQLETVQKSPYPAQQEQALVMIKQQMIDNINRELDAANVGLDYEDIKIIGDQLKQTMAQGN